MENLKKEKELQKLFSSYIERTDIVCYLFGGNYFDMMRYLYPEIYLSFSYEDLHSFKRHILKGTSTINQIRQIFADKIYEIIVEKYGIEKWDEMYKKHLDNYPEYREDESEERCKELLERFRKLSNYKCNKEKK